MIKQLFLIIVLSIAGLLAYMALFEDQFIYFPAGELTATPADYGMQFEECSVTTDDAVKLHGWYMPLPSSRFTVLHFHGNAGNISHRLSLYRQWQAMGLSVYAIEYRGYGQSEGEPGEAGIYNDARAAWRDLTKRLSLKPEQVIIAGRSLGAAVAAKLASEVKAAGVVLETPFTSIPDMAAYHYPMLPLRWLVRSQYDVETMVKSLHMPLLLISAGNDEIVAAGMAERIFAAANEPKIQQLLTGGHNDFDMRSDRAYSKVWLNWLKQLPAL